MATLRRIFFTGLSALLLTLAAEAQEPLTLDAAWRRVLAASPGVAALAEEREAVAGEADQASLQSNPEFSTDVENVIGTRPYQGVRGAEVTVQLKQTYVRAAKRKIRGRFAGSALPVAEAELAIKLADLRQQAAAAFTSVLIAQEQVNLRRDAAELARRTLDTVRRQHEAGQASGIDLARASVELSSAQVAFETATTALTLARRTLAAQWGGAEADFPSVAGELEVAGTLADFGNLAAKIEGTPDLQLLAVESKRRELAVAYEKSVATRDVTVGGGVRYFRDGDDAAFVLGVSVPLLVHDRNQGAIRAARARLRQVPHQANSVRLALRAELAARYAELVTARREATALSREVLPSAAEVVRQNEAALAQGRTSLLPVLEAQRNLLEARERRLDAISRYLQAQVALERLTQPPEPLPTPTS